MSAGNIVLGKSYVVPFALLVQVTELGEKDSFYFHVELHYKEHVSYLVV